MIQPVGGFTGEAMGAMPPLEKWGEILKSFGVNLYLVLICVRPDV